jgi:hypothetical protein
MINLTKNAGRYRKSKGKKSFKFNGRHRNCKLDSFKDTAFAAIIIAEKDCNIGTDLIKATTGTKIKYKKKMKISSTYFIKI